MKRVLVVLVVVCGLVPSLPAGPALATCANEYTKFVQDDSFVYPVWGNRSTVWTYNHLPICSGAGGAVAESTFVRFNSSGSDYVETGAQQAYYDTSNHTHTWMEWRIYPVVTSHTYDAWTGVLTTGTNYSFMLQLGGGTSWDGFVSHTNNPSTATWNHYGNSGNLGYQTGVRGESELSRWGTGDASDSVENLAEAAQPGAWVGWVHLGCDTNWDYLKDWSVVKEDNSSWYMLNAPPGTGHTC